MKTSFICGDVLAVLKTLPDNHFDAVLSDPPYGISFMGKEWDKGVPSAEVYAELNRVLKPGAFGLHFGGTRMWHRLAVNLEDAGFELRDTVMWLYGSGFPKSHNISKAIDKRGGACAEFKGFRAAIRKAMADKGLKRSKLQEALGNHMLSHYLTNGVQPAVPNLRDYLTIRDFCGLGSEWDALFNAEAEREVVGHQDGTLLAVAPGLDNDRSQTTIAVTAPATDAAKLWDGYGTALKPAWEPALLVQKPLAGTFANNALTHGCGGLNIDGSRVSLQVGEVKTGGFGNGGIGLSEGVASSTNGQGVQWQDHTEGRFPANLMLDEESAAALDAMTGDKQGPSRFFYTAKVSTRERNAGCGALADKEWAGDGACVPERDNRPFNPSKNNHPTLKPLALTEYLAKLLLVPPRADGQPRRILVPFSGAGSEVIGAALAGWDEVVGIEIDPEYIKIAQARAAHHLSA